MEAHGGSDVGTADAAFVDVEPLRAAQVLGLDELQGRSGLGGGDAVALAPRDVRQVAAVNAGGHGELVLSKVLFSSPPLCATQS